MPGDIPYQVQLPPGAAPAAERRIRRHEAVRSTDPWYTSLWHTIADTPHGPPPTRRPAPGRRRPFRPPPPPATAASRRRPVVDPADLDAVARQLGREPRGVLEIAYRCPNGEPAVVKTAPRLPDGTPFPTLYYLTHPALTAAASRLESDGRDAGDDRTAARRSREWPRPIGAPTSPIWPSATPSSRWARHSPAGGMPDRVKCLHVLMAHALAKGRGVNPFGDEALAMLAGEPAMAGILAEEEWT